MSPCHLPTTVTVPFRGPHQEEDPVLADLREERMPTYLSVLEAAGRPACCWDCHRRIVS